MRSPTLQSRVCADLIRIGTRLATGFDQHFVDLGITQAQFRVLLGIWELGRLEGASPSALAEHLFIERGTVSVLSSRMVDKGWLARRAGVNRRTYLLTLTPSGRRVMELTLPRAQALARRTLAGLSDKPLRQLEAGLDLIEKRLRAAVSPAT